MIDFFSSFQFNAIFFILLSVFLAIIVLIIIRLFIKRNILQNKENISLLFNQVNDAVFLFNLDKPYSIIELNDVASELFGYTPDELKGMPITDLQGEPDIDRFSHNMETLNTEKKISFESTIRTRNNRKLIVDCRVSLFAHKNRTIALASIRDISKHKRLKNILRVKKEILEMIARKEDLNPIFNRLIEMIEWHSSGAIASIMIADEKQERLYHAASLKLPKHYTDEIEGLPIKEMSGTCGTAAFRKESVYSIDLFTDESWSEYRGLVGKYQLQACYSAPILSSNDTILGTFAMYYDRNHSPVPEDIELLEIGCKLCGLAIENKQMEEQLLQKTEEKYQLIIENMSDMVLLINTKTGLIEFASPAVENVLGIDEKTMISCQPIDWVHEDDRSRILEMRHRVIRALQSEQAELRLVHCDGQLVDVEAKYIPIKGDNHSATNLLIVARDITERKRLQERMDSVKNDFINAMKQQHGMTLKFTEQNGKFIYTFADGQLLYNLGFIPEDIVGKDIFEILTDNPCLARTIQDANRRAWLGEENVTYEAFLAGIHYMCTLKPIRRKGKVVEAIVSSIDITERKRIEAALIESEAQHRSHFELSPDAIFIQREDAKILNANPAAAQLLGVQDVSLLIGRIGYDFIPKEEREPVRNVFSNVGNSEKKYLPEYQVITETGEFKHVEAISTGIIYNGEPARQTVLRDVTERKQAEEALRQSEEKYRLITENMHDMIAVTDLIGNMKYISPMHKNMLGIEESDYDSIDYSHYIHEEDQYLIREAMLDIASTHQSQQLEARMRLNEEETYLEINLLPVRSEEETISQIIWVASDITEKKQKEELLRKTDKLSVVSELAAGVAHEIKNPLTTLKGFAQLFEEDPELRLSDFLPVIQEELNRINYITDEFLSLAHPKEMAYVEVEVDQLITSAITLVKARFDSKDVSIKKLIHPDCPRLTCSRDRIKQMLINIITNSFEAIANEGTIVIEAKPNRTNNISISISDSGGGIPPDRIAKLGEPHYSNSEKGTGIGLMVSYKIIQDHKGTITFTSDEGKGTTAEIILPISQDTEVDQLEASVNKYNMLTAREKDVLSLIGKGKSNKEIATELNISESTVKNHITKIFNKLDISDRSQAIVMLYQKEVI